MTTLTPPATVTPLIPAIKVDVNTERIVVAPNPIDQRAIVLEDIIGASVAAPDVRIESEKPAGMDGGAGPEAAVVQIPGLKYDSDAKEVVYDAGGKKTVCAMVRKRKILFWKTLAVTPTGACVVTSRHDEHVEDTGWGIRRVPAVDTFFEVH